MLCSKSFTPSAVEWMSTRIFLLPVSLPQISRALLPIKAGDSLPLPAILRLCAQRLAENDCKDVCMESTGKYWIPIYFILSHIFNISGNEKKVLFRSFLQVSSVRFCAYPSNVRLGCLGSLVPNAASKGLFLDY